MKNPSHQHAWDKFWDYEDENEESRTWAAVLVEEDRRILELEIEGMIEESIPRNLEPLRHAYNTCDWATVPKNAATDLESALFTVVIEDGELDADCVFARLQPGPMLGSAIADAGAEDAEEDADCALAGEHRDLIILEDNTRPQPQVELSFPRQNLDIFVICLDQYASRTIQAFEKGYPCFLRSIPTTVAATLDFCLIDLIVPTLMDKLRAQ